jgi:polar amino acid transport system substrate-binding protein
MSSMNNKLAMLVAAAAILLVGFFVGRMGNPASTKLPVVESQLERILERDKIRCSYLIYSPYFRKDPNTGKLSGIFYEIMEEIGKAADLEVEWVEEVGYENIFTGLESGRHDVFAGGLWPSTSRAKSGGFSIPVFYSAIKAWARIDETRFDGLKGIDGKEVRIATIDGAMEDIIAKNDFSLATRVSLPEMSPFSQNLLNITSKKADITFAEPGVVHDFLKTNPGTLKEVAPDKALRIFGNSLVVRRDDYALKAFLDISLQELLYSGAVDRILKKYEEANGIFPRVAIPYRPETAILAIPSN